MSARDPLGVLAPLAGDAWLVGGAVRDRISGRAGSDFDVAVAGDPAQLARALGRAAGGHSFELSEGFGAWRVVAHDRRWQVDLIPLAGQAIEDDLRQRDFSINALAQPLAGEQPILDPYGGVDDLRARRVRMVRPDVFARDPLRTMRLARIACELDFVADPATAAAARASAAGLVEVAPERVFSELKRIVSAERALAGLELMDEIGATDAVLPELVRLRGVEQSQYHHLDVHAHTRAVLAETIAIERDPGPSFGAYAEAVRSLLAEPFTHELTRGQALRFGALFHDVAKPQTRGVTETGRVTFIGHDAAGAEVACAALLRLRAGKRLAAHVAALTRHHLRLGFLVHALPLSRRTIYRYLTACSPVAVDVTLLSVADRLATRGKGADDAIAKHLELARELLAEAFQYAADPPQPPIRGDQLARALGLARGPELGRLLAELREASFAGEVSGRDQAIEFARERLGQGLRG